jgi:hypothetical protein
MPPADPPKAATLVFSIFTIPTPQGFPPGPGGSLGMGVESKKKLSKKVLTPKQRIFILGSVYFFFFFF